jgi:hypothetical protein
LQCNLANGDWAESSPLAAALCACHVELLRLENEVKDDVNFQRCYVLLYFVPTRLMDIIMIILLHMPQHFLAFIRYDSILFWFRNESGISFMSK